MKRISLLFVAALAVTACKKENGSEDIKPKDVMYPVHFTVSDMDISVSPIKSSTHQVSTDSLKNFAYHLYYRVYTSNTGTLVASQDQTNTSASFGKISTELPSGTYYAVFAASSSSLGWNPSNSAFFPSAEFSFNTNAPGDTFFKRINFTVTNTGISQSVVLDRIVAGLELHITEPIPANITRISIVLKADPLLYSIDNDQKGFYTERFTTFDLTAADKGVANKTFTTYPSGNGSAVIIRAMAGNNIVVEKIVQNVPFYTNKKTTLSGKLFNNSTVSFNISVNGAWDSPPPVIPF